jgi:hypothetical protein
MPYTFEDYKREVRIEAFMAMTDEDAEEIKRTIPLEKRLAIVSISEILENMSIKDYLNCFTVEELYDKLSPAKLKALEDYFEKQNS